jgi:hypothetical protein
MLLTASTVAFVLFLRSTPDAFPYGDVAVIEMTTLAALRGFVTLGPYSQFGWHHPGPLCFYLLAPFYQLAGHRSIGMVAGALAINLTALIVIGWAAARHGGRVVAVSVLLLIGVYLLRAGDLAASTWNPHLVVVPIIALTVLSAACSIGDAAALLVATALACFLAQTSVSTIPYVAVLFGVSGAIGVATSGDSWQPGGRTRWFWIGSVAVVALILWLPPLIEQWTHRPGNMTRLWRFFVLEQHGGQSWKTAIRAWADMTTAATRAQFELPWGHSYVARGSWGVAMCAVSQVVLLVPAALWAARKGHRFVGRLCLLTALGSVAACWSITRIADEIGDYQIFWMTAVGALNVTLLCCVACVAAAERASWFRRGAVSLMTLTIAVSITLVTVRGLASARSYALEQRDSDVTRKVVALATEQYLEREHIRRPLFRISEATWLQSSGVILHVYKVHPRMAVDERWVPVLGEALAPDGREDIELQIAGGCQDGQRVVAHDPGLCVYELRRQ